MRIALTFAATLIVQAEAQNLLSDSTSLTDTTDKSVLPDGITTRIEEVNWKRLDSGVQNKVLAQKGGLKGLKTGSDSSINDLSSSEFVHADGAKHDDTEWVSAVHLKKENAHFRCPEGRFIAGFQRIGTEGRDNLQNLNSIACRKYNAQIEVRQKIVEVADFADGGRTRKHSWFACPKDYPFIHGFGRSSCAGLDCIKTLTCLALKVKVQKLTTVENRAIGGADCSLGKGSTESRDETRTVDTAVPAGLPMTVTLDECEVREIASSWSLNKHALSMNAISGSIGVSASWTVGVGVEAEVGDVGVAASSEVSLSVNALVESAYEWTTTSDKSNSEATTGTTDHCIKINADFKSGVCTRRVNRLKRARVTAKCTYNFQMRGWDQDGDPVHGEVLEAYYKKLHPGRKVAWVDPLREDAIQFQLKNVGTGDYEVVRQTDWSEVPLDQCNTELAAQ